MLKKVAEEMDEGARYREFAANCVRAAQEVANQSMKVALLDMAQTWIMLANQRERALVPLPLARSFPKAES